MGNEALIEKVATAIFESLDLSASLKDDMNSAGEFEKAAQAALEASNITALEAERDALREALAKIRRAFVSIPDHDDADVRCGNYAWAITAAIQTIDAALNTNRRDGQ